MEPKTIFFFVHFLSLTVVSLGSSSFDCNYGNYNFNTIGYKYRCLVSNNLNISSPESALIDAVNGVHISGKSNTDEIYFYIIDKHIEFFPRGLEKFFANLAGFGIRPSQLKEIHQNDLKPYTKLKCLSIGKSNIEVIEDGLFDFQPDIEAILIYQSKIFHISSTVFDNLSKLTTLHLWENKCTNKYSENSRLGVVEVIESVKSTCISSDYIKLDEKIRNLEQSSKNLKADNFTSFRVNFESFKSELENSKFSNFQSLNERVAAMSGSNQVMLLTLDYRIGKLFEGQPNISERLTKIDDRMTSLEDKMDQLTNSINQIVSTIQSYKSDLNDHMTIVKDNINQSSEVNGIWKSILIICCTFLITFIIFIAYKKFLYRAMIWQEDEQMLRSFGED